MLATTSAPAARHPARRTGPLLALAAVTTLLAAPALAAQAHGDADAAEAPGPVEALYKERKYEEALAKADELKGAKRANPDSEYWAGRTLRVLDRFDEAAARFRALSRDFPGTPRAASADIDAVISVLGKMPSGEKTPADYKLAVDSGGELLGVARKHARDPDTRARALYIAGNAFRMGHADAQAEAAYGECQGLSDARDTGYPAKCTLGLGTIKARNWDAAGARALYRECALQSDDQRTSQRCSKSLARTELVGAPAPELQVETWVNSTPTPLSSLRGNVVMLFFFATWCPHCKEPLPTLPRLQSKFAGKPFQLMALTNNARGQTTEGVQLFVQDPQWRMDYPVAVDAAGATTIAMEASGIPQVILIDKKGVVRWSDHPAYLRDEMIETLLAEPGA
jgi:thiol-disulfide isomerase/thioredoxin